MLVASWRSVPCSQWLWSIADTSTSNSPDCAISSNTRGKTTRSSSIAQQSTGLPTWVKFGNSAVMRARSSAENRRSGIPACSALSAKYSPSPPELVTAPMRRPRGGRRAGEHLEVLDPLAEVVDPDRVVVAQHRRQPAVGPDQGAGVRERRLGAQLGGADLEHDRDLAGLGQALQRGLERGRPAHGLEEQPDHLRRRVVREPGHEVGGVDHRLVAGRDDGAEADPRAERHQDLADRAGVGQRRDRPGHERRVQAADPGRREARASRRPCSSGRPWRCPPRAAAR